MLFRSYNDMLSAALSKKNSDDFRTSNGSEIVVTIGNYKWDVVYLSTNRQKEPIVTLWLTDSEQLPDGYKTAPLNTYTTDSSEDNYPSSMYGTSRLRALTLNNGGTYFDDSAGNVSHNIAKDENNPFAIFTMENAVGSISKFIDVPENVEWQEMLSAKDHNFQSSGVKYDNNFLCDSYKTDLTGFQDRKSVV